MNRQEKINALSESVAVFRELQEILRNVERAIPPEEDLERLRTRLVPLAMMGVQNTRFSHLTEFVLAVNGAVERMNEVRDAEWDDGIVAMAHKRASDLDPMIRALLGLRDLFVSFGPQADVSVDDTVEDESAVRETQRRFATMAANVADAIPEDAELDELEALARSIPWQAGRAAFGSAQEISNSFSEAIAKMRLLRDSLRTVQQRAPDS